MRDFCIYFFSFKFIVIIGHLLGFLSSLDSFIPSVFLFFYGVLEGKRVIEGYCTYSDDSE